MSTREFQFVVGPETATQPTAGTPSADDDFMTLGYADNHYMQGGEAVADVAALKAVAEADRTDNDVRHVDSLQALYKFDSGSSATNDDDWVIQPTAGTGRWLKLTKTATDKYDLQNQAELRCYEQTGNGTDYTGWKAPDDLSSTAMYKLPTSGGSAGQYLKEDGLRNLSWDTPAGAGNNEYLAKSANYTITDVDNARAIGMTTGAGDKTVDLPTAADNADRFITLKKEDAGAGKAILDGEGGELIDGALTVELRTQDDHVTVMCDGTGWLVVSKLIQPFWQQKVLAANVTSTGSVASLGFTLVSGSTYEIMVQVYMDSNNTDTATAIQIKDNTTVIGGIAHRNSNGGGLANQKCGVNILHTMSSTSLVFDANNVSANGKVLGNGTTDYTWVTVREVFDHVTTSAW